jgi:hypothetical protein
MRIFLMEMEIQIGQIYAGTYMCISMYICLFTYVHVCLYMDMFTRKCVCINLDTFSYI